MTSPISSRKAPETVGPISVTYADGARQYTKYAAVDAALASLLCKGGAQIAVVRA